VRRRSYIAGFAVAAFLTAPLPAQPRTGSVAGVVVTGDSPPQLVRRATISLISAEWRVPLSAITDDAGRFELSDVPPGHYTVVASKAAYVGAFYGSKQPGRGPGVPLAVPAGSRVTNLRLTLIRGSVIAGTLRLPGGGLAHNMPITVVAIETVNGVRRLRLAGGRTTTDDRGEYRVFGLPPGEYLVQAQASGLITGAPTAGNDALQTTAAEVSWAQALARGSSSAIAAAPPPAPPPGRTMNYATVFFPGTPDPTLATGIHVGPGEERRGIDFALVLVPTTTISGTTLTTDGQPFAKVSLQLVAQDDGLSIGRLLTPRPVVQSAADGSFAMTAVPPGRYRLIATASSSLAATAKPPRPIVQTVASAGAGQTSAGNLWAVEEIVVDGRELPRVALTMQPGLTVKGRLVFKTSSRAQPVAEDFARARVSLVPVAVTGGAAEALLFGASAPSAAVEPDGSFLVSGIAPGRYRLSVTMPGLTMNWGAAADGWFLQSTMHRGVDVADDGFEVRPGDAVDGVIATFIDRGTELRGTLSDGSGRPVSGYPILVFPTDRGRWSAGSRHVAVARPSTDGTFRIAGLPSGTYFLCAVVRVDPSDLHDPAFLEQLVAGALTVTLKEGVATVQSLRLAGG
jgi:hypothetical protein